MKQKELIFTILIFESMGSCEVSIEIIKLFVLIRFLQKKLRNIE